MAETDKSDAEKILLLKSSQLPRISEKGLKAQRVINKYTVLASGIGFIPFPCGWGAFSETAERFMPDLWTFIFRPSNQNYRNRYPRWITL